MKSRPRYEKRRLPTLALLPSIITGVGQGCGPWRTGWQAAQLGDPVQLAGDDGRLVESLHVVEAERQVALADAIAALGG
jgi:hypothetical protein